ncbi:MAG: DUF6057 family protein [Bacteroidaceae bacterium]|nr:DUF6057 family protein [Bacteroidaceae bacterium]
MDYKGLTQRIFKPAPYVLAVVLWCILTLKEQFFLYKVENLSVFLFDKLFIADSLKIPGGFLGLAGSFLTQFLHLPWLGALIWVLLLLTAYQLTIRVFRIPESYHPLALIPIVLLIIGNMSLGYGVFIMREQDHFFAPLLGYMVSLLPITSTRRLNTLWSRIIFLTIWTAAGYILFGTFAFTGTLAAVLSILIQPSMKRKERPTLFSCGIVLIILVPLAIYSAYTSYRLADSWVMGLPSVSDDAWTRPMRAPFQIALLCQILFALTSRFLSEKPLEGIKSYVFRSAMYIIAIVAVWGFWFKDDNFHTELAMSEAVDRFDWDRTIEIFRQAEKSHAKSDAKAYASRSKKIESAHSIDQINEIVEHYKDRFFEPTRSMVLYRDLALLKTNRALGEAFTMKDGSRMQESRTIIPMVWQSGKQFYLQYGLVNMCYRWCLEDVIEHNWSYSTLKYMAMHSVIMQEPELADKYINKLEKTLFYRKWARQQDELKSDREKMSATEPYSSILPYMCFENQMSNDMMKTEAYLINHFLDKEPDLATPEYDRAALLFAMHIQDIPRFWERLFYYVNSNDINELPRSVQEAALLYSTLKKDGRELPLDEKVVKSYDEFNRYVQNHPIRSMKESEYPYCQKFGKTFFYFYFFMRDLKTY